MSKSQRQLHDFQPSELSVVQQHAPTSAPAIASKCSMSRLICVQLLILLSLLTLAAVIIPIVVIVFDARSTTPPCARTYSETFVFGSASPAQCAAWQAFTTGLTCTSYSMLRMYGSADPTGITLSNANAATALAIALRYNTTITVINNGVTWRVGGCGGFEISATGSICSCPTGFTMRPCHGGSNWGGINGATCGAANQTMSLYFE